MKRYCSSSVGKKQIMGAMGLMLCVFLIVHLIGNMTMLISAELFNTYAHKLITNPLIYFAEVILALVFISHIGLALKITVENAMARPQGYYAKTTTGRGATFASSTMPYTGAIILIFLIVHLINFKYGAMYFVTYDGVEMRDLYKLVVEFYQTPIHVISYVVAMIALGIHTAHGLWSALQTFGLNHPRYNKFIKGTSLVYGLIICIGFSIIPIWSYYQGGH